MAARRVWRDGARGYGWLSIALHWSTAAIIMALLFIGDSIGTSGGGEMVAWHTSIAVTMYPILVARLAWRLAGGHPGASPRQRPRGFAIGKLIHYTLLLCVTVLLMTGPLLAWSGGFALRLGGVIELPNPIGADATVHASLLRAHAAAATLLAVLIALHIAAVFKHLLINKDETFERMMVASAPEDEPPDRISENSFDVIRDVN